MCHHTVYHWSRELLHRELPRFGVEVVPVDMRESAELAAALETRTDVVYFEPPPNPTLDIVDAPAVIAAAHAAGARAVVDATWLTPYLFRPLEHGADAVIHSATKFLCGHGDALAGVVVTRDAELPTSWCGCATASAESSAPMNAYLLMRGMKTLPIRMRQHCGQAQFIAEYLERHPKVTQVWYPGLAGTRGHDIARAQWSGFGGMLGFALESRRRATPSSTGGALQALGQPRRRRLAGARRTQREPHPDVGGPGGLRGHRTRPGAGDRVTTHA